MGLSLSQEALVPLRGSGIWTSIASPHLQGGMLSRWSKLKDRTLRTKEYRPPPAWPTPALALVLREALLVYTCLPVSKNHSPNPESHFPTLRKEGMPTYRRALVAQSHPGRRQKGEAAGHGLTEEGLHAWPATPTLRAQGWAGGRVWEEACGGSWFFPLEVIGPGPVCSHLWVSVSYYKQR